MMLFLRQATKHLQMSPSIYINIVNESEKYQELYDYLNNNKNFFQLSMFSFLLSEKKTFLLCKNTYRGVTT